MGPLLVTNFRRQTTRLLLLTQKQFTNADTNKILGRKEKQLLATERKKQTLIATLTHTEEYKHKKKKQILLSLLMDVFCLGLPCLLNKCLFCI